MVRRKRPFEDGPVAVRGFFCDVKAGFGLSALALGFISGGGLTETRADSLLRFAGSLVTPGLTTFGGLFI